MDRVRCCALVAFNLPDTPWPKRPLGRCTGRPWRLLAATAALLAVFTAGCAVPVVGTLEEDEANRVVVALDEANIGVSKEADPASEGKFRVMVAAGDVPVALSVMRNAGAPRLRPASLSDSAGKGGLVPSELAEQAGIMAGMAGDLERSLEGVEGVLSGRVHLSLPPLPSWRESPGQRSSASVLIEFRGATPPIAADSVQRLVAGAVSGLAPSDVVVVMLPHPSPPTGPHGTLAHVGPIAVARESVRVVQGVALTMLLCLCSLSLGLLVIWSRLLRTQARLREASFAPDTVA